MESLKRFFNMYFVAHDIMSRTARVDCDAKWDEDAPQHRWLDNADLDEVGSYLFPVTNEHGRRSHSILLDRLTQLWDALGV
jgi:hypothetical protein